MHQLLCMPGCPVALLRRNQLATLRAIVDFRHGNVHVNLPPLWLILTLNVPWEKEWRLHNRLVQKTPKENREFLGQQTHVGAEDNPPVLVIHEPPVRVELKLGATPVAQHQYLIPQWKIQPDLEEMQAYDILVLCKSPSNTSLLPVRKADTGDYHLVQDL